MVLLAAVLLVSYSGDCVSDSHSQDEPHPARVDRNDWRRTATGWEQAGNWQPNPPMVLAVTASPSAGAMHPLVVAALELLISLAALLHFSPAGTLRGKKVGLNSGGDEIA